MNKVRKITGLFFAALLFSLSIVTEHYGLQLASNLQKSHSENSDIYFSGEKTDFFFVFRNNERQVNSFRNLPVQSFKSHQNEINFNNFSPETRILSINSRYISYSAIIDRSLSTSDIVFPFHYFW
jgi:hypothetical protein